MPNKHFRRAVNMLRAAFGPNHLAVAVAEVNLAHAFIRSGNLSDAHALLEHSAPIEKNAMHPGPYLAMCLERRIRTHSRGRSTLRGIDRNVRRDRPGQ